MNECRASWSALSREQKVLGVVAQLLPGRCEVSYGGLLGRRNSPFSAGYRLTGCVRLIECLLDRRRDPAPIVDAVTVLAGPVPHSSGLRRGLPTAINPGVTGATTVA